MDEREKTTIQPLGSPINSKILFLIAVLAVAHLIFITYSEETDELQFGDITYGLSALASGIMALIVAKRYWGSEIFGRAYFALGIAFLFLFSGDLIYNYYVYALNQDPYPSIADLFFLAFPVFAMLHLVTNIKYFKRNIGIPAKVLTVTIAAVITLVYAYFSLQDLGDTNFDFYFGILFVATSSLILSHAILGASIFRQSVLGTTWLLLAIGIFIFTVADVWYYYLELFDAYSYNHPTNTLWVLANMVIIYALYNHRRAI